MSRYYVVSTIFLVLLLVSMILDGAVHVPKLWYISLMGVYIIITVAGASALSLQYFVPVISTGNTQGIAITFDDGPTPGRTEEVLDVLKRFQAPAAFFCIGKKMESNPEILRRIDAEGHLIGNHSFTHSATFDLKSSVIVTKELYDTDVMCQKITGKRLRFFRPPYGVTNPMLAKAVRRLNCKVIGWSVRSFDTVAKDPEKLLSRVTRSLKPGDIVLFHDHCKVTIEILPAFLEHVERTGLKVVRLDELVNEKAYA